MPIASSDVDVGKVEKPESFTNFIKANKEKIRQLKKEYNNEVTEAGLQDLLLLLWLLGEDEAVIFDKLKHLLDRLLKGRFIKFLSRFKLKSDRIKRAPKKKQTHK